MTLLLLLRSLRKSIPSSPSPSPSSSKSLSTVSCPLSYRTSPQQINRLPITPTSPIVYIIGGLYGNTQALAELYRLKSLEKHEVTMIFNGDFNFFNHTAESFLNVNESVLNIKHNTTSNLAIKGNVESEISSPSSEYSGGCGCSYPSYVSPDVIKRSDSIVNTLRDTAQKYPHIYKRLQALPGALKINIGNANIGVIHGDPYSLAGWKLSVEAMSPVDHKLRFSLNIAEGGIEVTSESDVTNMLNEAKVDAFATTHTCLSFAQVFDNGGCVFNNGSAGMSNYKNSTDGVFTRIAPLGSSFNNPHQSLSVYGYADHSKNVRYDSIRIAFDKKLWEREFMSMWNPGSPAYESYWNRIKEGVGFWEVEQGKRGGIE